jgi:hypothetical protein
MYETRKRTILKAIIYRVWILTTTFILFLISGHSVINSILPTLGINIFWMCGYIAYERIWQKIEWGKCKK